MLTKTEKPWTKRDLLAAITKASPRQIIVLEGDPVQRLKQMRDFSAANTSVVVLRF
jgi:hypothetical protein